MLVVPKQSSRIIQRRVALGLPCQLLGLGYYLSIRHETKLEQSGQAVNRNHWDSSLNSGLVRGSSGHVESYILSDRE